MGHWTISWALEPIYVDDVWDGPEGYSYHDPYEPAECWECELDCFRVDCPYGFHHHLTEEIKWQEEKKKGAKE